MDIAQQTIVWEAFCLFALGLALWRPDAGRLVLGTFFIITAVGVNVVFGPGRARRVRGPRHECPAAFSLGMGLRTCGQ